MATKDYSRTRQATSALMTVLYRFGLVVVVERTLIDRSSGQLLSTVCEVASRNITLFHDDSSFFFFLIWSILILRFHSLTLLSAVLTATCFVVAFSSPPSTHHLLILPTKSTMPQMKQFLRCLCPATVNLISSMCCLGHTTRNLRYTSTALRSVKYLHIENGVEHATTAGNDTNHHVLGSINNEWYFLLGL